MLIRITDYHGLFYELYNKMCYVCIYALLRLGFTKDLGAFTSGHC
jgi:hypothetical protein